MEKTVLILDSNPVILAIARAALEPLSATLHVCSNLENAAQQISMLRPALILCPDDIAGIDPFKICSEAKAEDGPESPFFILMASGTGKKDISSKAKEIGIDEILRKPFKANELRALVDKLFTETSVEQIASLSLALLVQDNLRKKIITRILDKRGASYRSFDNTQSFEKALSNTSFTATIVEKEENSSFKWHNAESMGTLLIITESRDISVNDFPKDSRPIPSPLTLHSLESSLDDFLPLAARENSFDFTPLERGEQTLLAARISASVFQILLTQETFRNRKWEETCALIGAGALKICRDFCKK